MPSGANPAADPRAYRDATEIPKAECDDAHGTARSFRPPPGARGRVTGSIRAPGESSAGDRKGSRRDPRRYSGPVSIAGPHEHAELGRVMVRPRPGALARGFGGDFRESLSVGRSESGITRLGFANPGSNREEGAGRPRAQGGEDRRRRHGRAFDPRRRGAVRAPGLCSHQHARSRRAAGNAESLALLPHPEQRGPSVLHLQIFPGADSRRRDRGGGQSRRANGARAGVSRRAHREHAPRSWRTRNDFGGDARALPPSQDASAGPAGRLSGLGPFGIRRRPKGRRAAAGRRGQIPLPRRAGADEPRAGLVPPPGSARATTAWTVAGDDLLDRRRSRELEPAFLNNRSLAVAARNGRLRDRSTNAGQSPAAG